MDQNELLEFYTCVELAYENVFKEQVSDVSELYPEGWYGNNDYKLKIEILTEAIDKDVLIVNTDSYQEIIKDVKGL